LSHWIERQELRRRMTADEQERDRETNDWGEVDRVEELVASLRGLDASHAGYVLWRASLDHPEDNAWLDKALIAVQSHREEAEEDEGTEDDVPDDDGDSTADEADAEAEAEASP